MREYRIVKLTEKPEIKSLRGDKSKWTAVDN